MTNKYILFALATATLGAGAFAIAQEPGERGDRRAKMIERFFEADLNGDGVVTKDETLAKRAEHFADVDTNGDGVLTEGELTAHA